MTRKANPFKGKSIEDISSISMEEFNSMDRATLSKAVSRLSSAANKRLRRFESKGIESPAVLSARKSGGKFGARGKNLNQLRSEFIRVRNFLRMKTATQKGYRKVKKDFIERVQATTGQQIKITDEFLNKFWRIYDKTANLAPFIKGSEGRQKMVYDELIENPEISEDDLLQKLNDAFTLKYEEERILENEFGASQFFRMS